MTKSIFYTLPLWCWLMLQPVSSIADTDKGSKLFTDVGCILCHRVSSSDIGNDDAPGGDLSDTSKNVSRAELIDLVQGKSARKPDRNHSKPFRGSDEELQVLVDWLLEQKAEE